MSDGLFGPPSSSAVAGIEALLGAGALLAFGYLVVAALDGSQRFGTWDRAALAFPAVVGYSLLLMALHVVTVGRVLSNRWLVVVVTVAVAVTCTFRARAMPAREREGDYWIAGAIALGALVVWSLPVFRLLPVFVGGDPGLHAGWANQLLNGEVLPTSPIPADVPNYYPWMFHALTAVITHFTPGENPYLAQGPLQILQPVALALGFLALGRRLFTSTTGAVASALFGAFAGGIGFLWSRGPEVLMHPATPGAADTYAGDLLFVRGPAVAFTSLAPVFPRDVALTLLVPALLLILIGLQRRDPRTLAAGGIVLGLAGLVGPEPFFVGVPLVAGVVWRVTERRERVRALLAAVVLPIAIYALWAVPIIYNFVRLDGFVNTSEIGPIDLPWYGFLGALGIAIPFAVLGAIGLSRRAWGKTTSTFVTMTLLIPLAVLICAGFIPKLFGEGFTVLGRTHRYWPLVSLGLSLFAGAGVTMVASILPRRRFIAIGTAAGVVALVSPIFATIAFIDEVPRAEVVEAALEGDATTVYEAIDGAGGRCVVAGRAQGALVFAYTGFRHLDYEWRPGRQNDARVRWKRTLGEIPSDDDRARANEQIADGRIAAGEWRQLVDRFGVDLVVTDVSGAEAPRYRTMEGQDVQGAQEPFVLFRVNECD